MINRRSLLKVAAAIGAPIIVPRFAVANTWPSRTITLVVAYGPGGTTDQTARPFAEFLSQRLGQAVVVENRAGAQANLGFESVARSAPDGYTLTLSTPALNNNAIFGPKPKIDFANAFEHVGKLALASNIVMVRPEAGVKTMVEAVELSKARPNELTIGAGQIDTAVKLLNRRAGASFRLVPYRSSSQAATDAIAGHVDFAMTLVPSSISLIGQQLIGLGISSRERLAVLPNVPTYSEAGIPDADVESWFGLSVPKHVSPLIVERLAAEVRAFVQDRDTQQRLHKVGITTAPAGTPKEFARFISEEAHRWKQIADELGLSAG